MATEAGRKEKTNRFSVGLGLPFPDAFRLAERPCFKPDPLTLVPATTALAANPTRSISGALRARLAHEGAAAAVIAAAGAVGSITGVRVTEPSLEDVFLTLTGHALRE